MPDSSQPQPLSDETQPALFREAVLWARLPLDVAEDKPRVRVKLVQRNQMVIRTLDVERLLEPQHPARAIWELMGKYDLSHFYGAIAAVQGQAGRCPHDPRLLISLWLYSYMKGIVSAREIERRCEYDPAYIWLTGGEKVCAHTLSDYRTAHEKALKDLFIQHLAVLEKAGLVDLRQVTQDGTKISAAAGADTFRKKEKIEQHLERARQRVEELNRAAAEKDNESHTRQTLAAQQRAAREQLETLEQALAEVGELQKTAQEPEKVRVSITDPEARVMKQSNGGYGPSYNLQLTTDTRQTVIVSVDVTQDSNDAGQLQPAMERVQEQAGQAPEQVIADGSYTNRDNIVTMEQKHIDLIGPVPDGSVQKETLYQIRGVTEAFRPEAFHFDAEHNCYTCPAGKSLSYQRKNVLPGQTKYFYQAKRADCQSCIYRLQCCPKSKKSGRSVVRAEDSAEVKRFRAKMESEAGKAIYKKRGAVAEFPNLCIKERFGLRRFSLRGLAKVKIEGLWVALTFNVQQWMRLSWLPGKLQNSSAA